MSSHMKISESKKLKNLISPNYQNNQKVSNHSSNLYKAIISKNIQQKTYQTRGNLSKKHKSKNNTNYISNEENSFKQKIGFMNNKENVSSEENKITNNVINNVINSKVHENQNRNSLRNFDSFKALKYLIPNNEDNLEKTDDINEENRRYLKNIVYDYDGTIISSMPNFNVEQPENTKNSCTTDIKMDEIKLSPKKEIDPKTKKQIELIKKVMKYKNFQIFVKRHLANRKINIKFPFYRFHNHLYNIAFLDIYFRHRIPYIILRPRLDVIKKKRLFKERKKIEELIRNNEKNHHKLNYEVKEGETTYASILDKTVQNEMEKNGYKIGEDSNTVIIEKRESLFPTKDGKPRGIFTLTKIPQKSDENAGNVRLKMAFNKAKDAARVVRRLEYSYSMRVNILLSKPIFQKNAKIIQNWYRSIKFIKKNTPKIIKIQSYARGMMIRTAFKEVCYIFKHIIPFLKEIDKVISRRFAKIFFDNMIANYGVYYLIKLAKIQNNKIIQVLRRFMQKQQFIRNNFSISTKIIKKCMYTKSIYEFDIRNKIVKIQNNIKKYLMHNSEKIMLEFTNKYHPKLYFYLKYWKNPVKIQQKLQKLHERVIKLKELQLKTKYKDKNINNRFEYFSYIFRKKIFQKLKNYYYKSINHLEPNYQKKIKLKVLLNHQEIYNKKRILKRHFNTWNLKANYLHIYTRLIRENKILLIKTIMKYYKRYQEKTFMILLNSIKERKLQNEKSKMNIIINNYSKHNKIHNKEYTNNILERAFQIWRKNSKYQSLIIASNIINNYSRIFLEKKRIKKIQKLIICLNIRNRVFKEKIKLWKFNAGKLKHHFNSFINKTLMIIHTRNKLEALKKNINSLEKRKKILLKKYFERFQTNTGVKKLLFVNFQLCLYDENKNVIVNDNYSMMKYIKDFCNINKDNFKDEMTLKAFFNFWKSKQRCEEFKKKCGKRIQIKCQYEQNIMKLKLLKWKKINKMIKIEEACRIIQNKYKEYKNQKTKKQ